MLKINHLIYTICLLSFQSVVLDQLLSTSESGCDPNCIIASEKCGGYDCFI